VFRGDNLAIKWGPNPGPRHQWYVLGGDDLNAFVM
jgi:hypothetical protein